MKAIIIEDEKAAVRNLTSLLGEVCPQIKIEIGRASCRERVCLYV